MADLRKALERSLNADFNDRACHAAYADLLAESDDPALAARGEFIAVQLALEDEGKSPQEREVLRSREGELLREHGRSWIGRLGPFLTGSVADDPRLGITFERGWVTRLVVRRFFSAPLARAMARCPELRLLQDLAIESDFYAYGEPTEEDRALRDDLIPEAPPDYCEAEEIPRGPQHAPSPSCGWVCTSDLLVGSRYLRNVRRLRLGVEVGEDGRDFTSYSLSPAVPYLVAGMPKLEELYLLTKDYDPAALFRLTSLEHLRVLQMYHLEADHPLHLLAGNPTFGNLTHLIIHPHGFAHGHAYLSLDAVRSVLRSPHLKKLAHVRFSLSDMGDEGCAEIVSSGILKRLKTLSLRHGAVTDAGARTLADCPDLANLEMLDVERNHLTGAGIDALKGKVAGLLLAQDQCGAQDDYLNEGDFE